MKRRSEVQNGPQAKNFNVHMYKLCVGRPPVIHSVVTIMRPLLVGFSPLPFEANLVSEALHVVFSRHTDNLGAISVVVAVGRRRRAT